MVKLRHVEMVRLRHVEMVKLRHVEMVKLRHVVALIAVAITACSSTPSASVLNCAPSPFRSSPPQVIAHAGGEGLGPQNSVLAMQRSVAAGADIIDADLRITADGVVVAAHDRDISTWTDGVGNVDELTFDELEGADARAVWNGAPIDEPVRIPSLEQVLAAVPDGWISLEIKLSPVPMAGALCDVLRSTGNADRVYVSSNSDEALLAFHDRCPEVVITTTYGDLAAMRAARDAGHPICAPAPIGQPPYRFVNAESVAGRHAAGTAIFTWTVDDPDTLGQLAADGVDGVYTRRPDVARKVFDSLAE